MVTLQFSQYLFAPRKLWLRWWTCVQGWGVSLQRWTGLGLRLWLGWIKMGSGVDFTSLCMMVLPFMLVTFWTLESSEISVGVSCFMELCAQEFHVSHTPSWATGGACQIRGRNPCPNLFTWVGCFKLPFWFWNVRLKFWEMLRHKKCWDNFPLPRVTELPRAFSSLATLGALVEIVGLQFWPPQ